MNRMNYDETIPQAGVAGQFIHTVDFSLEDCICKSQGKLWGNGGSKFVNKMGIIPLIWSLTMIHNGQSLLANKKFCSRSPNQKPPLCLDMSAPFYLSNVKRFCSRMENLRSLWMIYYYTSGWFFPFVVLQKNLTTRTVAGIQSAK